VEILPKISSRLLLRTESTCSTLPRAIMLEPPSSSCKFPCCSSHVMSVLIHRHCRRFRGESVAVVSSRNSNFVAVTSSSLPRSSSAPARDLTTPVSRGNSKSWIYSRSQEVLNGCVCVPSIIEGTKESLQRLKLDYVDVIFAHRPDPTGEYPHGSSPTVRRDDPRLVPIEETVRAFNFVIEKGWVLIILVSGASRC